MTVRQEQAQSPAQQGQLDAIRQAVDSVEARLDKPLGLPTGVKTAAYQAQWGDLVRCSGTFNVTLPQTDRKRLGEVITVKNEGSSGTITVLAIKGDTIDGASSQSIAAGDCYQYVCAEPGKWIEATPRAVSGGGWVWAPTAIQAADYTCTAMYELVLVNNNGGNISVTLPDIGASDIGKMVQLKSVTNSPGGWMRALAGASDSIIETVQTTTGMKGVTLAVIDANTWAAIMDFEPELMG